MDIAKQVFIIRHIDREEFEDREKFLAIDRMVNYANPMRWLTRAELFAAAEWLNGYFEDGVFKICRNMKKRDVIDTVRMMVDLLYEEEIQLQVNEYDPNIKEF